MIQEDVKEVLRAGLHEVALYLRTEPVSTRAEWANVEAALEEALALVRNAKRTCVRSNRPTVEET